jgi:hypothetical protein
MAFGLAEFGAITYIHPCPLLAGGTDEQLNRMAGVSPSVKTFTPKQGHTWRISTCTPACIAGRLRKPTSNDIFASHRLPFTKWC